MTTWYHKLMWGFLKVTKALATHKENKVEVVYHGEEPKAPFLLLANHAHIDDPFILGRVIKHPINYVGNIGAVSLFKRIISLLVGVIPKKKGSADLGAVKQMLTHLRNGRAVGIFPEGDRSWDGETDTLLQGVMSIVKKAGVPLYVARLVGNYVSYPRWAEEKRAGSIRIEFHVIPKEKVLAMSKAEVTEKVRKLLYRNDVKEAYVAGATYSGKNLAHGIQYLLWWCPECGAHDSIAGEGDVIGCSACGVKWTLDGRMRLTPPNRAGSDLKDWADAQKNEAKRRIAAWKEGDAPLTTTENVAAYEGEEGEERSLGSGRFVLYPEEAIFIARDGVKTRWSIASIEHYIDNFNTTFQFRSDDTRISMRFHGTNAYKWIVFFTLLQAE